MGALRQGNAGENKAIEDRCKESDWQLNIKFEYTARATSQQNSLVKTSFTVIAARARATMTDANLPTEHRFAIFERVANWMVKLDWLTIVDINGVSKARIEHYGHEIPSWTKQIRTFGEAGTVKIGKKGKVRNCGVTMMYVGHADGHAGYVHRMWNQGTSKCSETRDVLWLNRMYFEETVKDYDKELGDEEDEEFWVNPNNTPEERRDDDDSENESISSSVADGDAKDEG